MTGPLHQTLQLPVVQPCQSATGRRCCGKGTRCKFKQEFRSPSVQASWSDILHARGGQHAPVGSSDGSQLCNNCCGQLQVASYKLPSTSEQVSVVCKNCSRFGLARCLASLATLVFCCCSPIMSHLSCVIEDAACIPAAPWDSMGSSSARCPASVSRLGCVRFLPRAYWQGFIPNLGHLASGAKLHPDLPTLLLCKCCVCPDYCQAAASPLGPTCITATAVHSTVQPSATIVCTALQVRAFPPWSRAAGCLHQHQGITQ
jgi:hypothetical protein